MLFLAPLGFPLLMSILYWVYSVSRVFYSVSCVYWVLCFLLEKISRALLFLFPPSLIFFFWAVDLKLGWSIFPVIWIGGFLLLFSICGEFDFFLLFFPIWTASSLFISFFIWDSGPAMADTKTPETGEGSFYHLTLDIYFLSSSPSFLSGK